MDLIIQVIWRQLRYRTIVYFLGKIHTRRIADFLGSIYPAMFKYEDLGPAGVPAHVGYGLGGLKGLKGLPDRICNMVLEIFCHEYCAM